MTFKKYFFMTVSIVVISIIALMMIFSVVLNNHITKTSHETLNNVCDQIYEKYENFSDTQSFLMVAETLAQVSGADVFLADAYGTVHVCACGEWTMEEGCMHTSYILPKRILDRAKAQDINEVSALGIYKFPHYVSVKAVGQARDYYIFATIPVKEAQFLIARVSRLYYMWAIIPVLFMVVAIYIMTYRLTKPLRSMSEAAKAMAKGDFSKRVPVTSDDEIGELAISFNGMTDSLSRLESTRRSFVANVSHELKTPLTSISGYAEIMKSGLVKPEDMTTFSERIYHEASRLIVLIGDIIKLSKLDEEQVEIEREWVDLYQLTREICSRLSLMAERKNVHLELTGESSSVYGVHQILDEMIYNICENAIKYNKENGKVVVWVGNSLQGAKVIVEDTGIGIPEEVKDRIFERFFRVDKSHSKETGGTGLGLSIVKHGAIFHHAQINVESELGKGTKMELLFQVKSKE